MRIGVLGGGQLGRMLALAGATLGFRFHIYDPDPTCPAADVATLTCAPFENASSLAIFGASVDVVTFETEAIPVGALGSLAGSVPVLPGPASLAATCDRLIEKEMLSSLGIPTPAFASASSLPTLANALRAVGLPAVVKTRTGGYDGRGQRVAYALDDARVIWHELGPAPLIVEAKVPFGRELSVIGVRGRDGTTRMYPIIENEHRDGMLVTSRAPASGMSDDARALACTYAERVMEHLDHVGVLTLEMFEIDGMLVANEVAPRVHNSGHWTIEGAHTSQFENHVRAIAGLPLGPAVARGVVGMRNLIGRLPDAGTFDPALGHLHRYGKRPRPRRKLGHVTIVASDADDVEERLAMLDEPPGAGSRPAQPLTLIRSTM